VGAELKALIAQPNFILRNRLCFVLPKILISTLQPTQFYQPSEDPETGAISSIWTQYNRNNTAVGFIRG
jgi:hypothetical protein